VLYIAGLDGDTYSFHLDDDVFSIQMEKFTHRERNLDILYSGYENMS